MPTADPTAVAALLAHFGTALLATRDADGHLRCRPMAMRHAVRGRGDLVRHLTRQRQVSATWSTTPAAR